MTAEDYGITPHVENKYWYNLKTGQVEQGFQSPAPDRAGPFDTRAEAENALEIIRARSAAWDEDDRNDDR